MLQPNWTNLRPLVKNMAKKRSSKSFGDAQALALELDVYRQILESASDAVVTINENHEVVYMNRAAEGLFGYKREELLGDDLAPLIPKEHRDKHRGYLERYLRTRQPHMIGHVAELTAERRDGTPLPVSIAFNVAQAGDGLLFTAILRDLTAERRLAQRARHAEALAAVGSMVATVNHEIRSPLTLIGGFANQLFRDESLGEDARHKMRIITEEVARLEGVLGELRDLTRPTRLEREEVDLLELVNHVKELMAERLANEEISLLIKAPRTLPKVLADRDRLSQVILNLLNNAAQASEPGSHIDVGLKTHKDGSAVLSVSDCGCGIQPDQRKDIFTPFFTTKKTGTGLGLPVSRRIVEEHGGSIKLHSSPGQGTTVVVTLPPAKKSEVDQIPAP